MSTQEDGLRYDLDCLVQDLLRISASNQRKSSERSENSWACGFYLGKSNAHKLAAQWLQQVLAASRTSREFLPPQG